jgi:MFS family permease
VFFLTRVWHYSIVRAGMAISLGPGIVALTAPRFGRLAARIGQRAVLIPGGLVYASAGLWLLTRASAHPHYLAMYLPASVLSAIGVAMCIPPFSSAAAAKLPSDQFATGSAVVQAVRYIAGSFGVALTIAFTTDHPGLSGFHRVWTVMLVCGLCVFAFASRLARRAPAS